MGCAEVDCQTRIRLCCSRWVQGSGDIGHAMPWGRREPPLLDALDGIAGTLVS